MNIFKIAISLSITVFIYMVWYKIAVGKFCPAMWYGTAPLFMGIVTF